MPTPVPLFILALRLICAGLRESFLDALRVQPELSVIWLASALAPVGHASELLAARRELTQRNPLAWTVYEPWREGAASLARAEACAREGRPFPLLSVVELGLLLVLVDRAEDYLEVDGWSNEERRTYQESALTALRGKLEQPGTEGQAWAAQVAEVACG